VISILRFQPIDPDAFVVEVRAALPVISACPGFVRATLGRSTDEPDAWMLLTEWESIGAFRRGLGGTAVRMAAMPLLTQALDVPSAFEPLVIVDGSGAVSERDSDRSSEP